MWNSVIKIFSCTLQHAAACFKHFVERFKYATANLVNIMWCKHAAAFIMWCKHADACLKRLDICLEHAAAYGHKFRRTAAYFINILWLTHAAVRLRHTTARFSYKLSPRCPNTLNTFIWYILKSIFLLVTVSVSLYPSLMY